MDWLAFQKDLRDLIFKKILLAEGWLIFQSEAEKLNLLNGLADGFSKVIFLMLIWNRDLIVSGGN